MQNREKTDGKNRRDPGCYRLIRWTVRCFSPKYQLSGTENLPDEPCVIVGNHCQIYGPIAAELYMPRGRYTWCVGEMMDRKEVPAYAFQDFWSLKPKGTHWFYRLLSHLIAPLSEYVFTHARTIPVYHDARVMTTFRRSMERLQEGADIVIFPEKNQPYNHVLCRFQENFADLALLYYRKTGTALRFVPMYITPALKRICFGEPVQYCPETAAGEEKTRICAELMESITGMAAALPQHAVVPYLNVPRKQYPLNKA